MSEYICKECKEDLVVVDTYKDDNKRMKYVTYKCPNCGRVILDNPEQMTAKEIEISVRAEVMAKGLWDKKEEVEEEIVEEVETLEEDENEIECCNVDVIENTKDSIDDYERKGFNNTTYYITRDQIKALLNGKLIAMCEGQYTNRRTTMIKLVEE